MLTIEFFSSQLKVSINNPRHSSLLFLPQLMTVPVTSLEHIVPGTLKNFSDTAQKQLHFLLKYLTRFLQYTKQLDSTADQVWQIK